MARIESAPPIASAEPRDHVPALRETLAGVLERLAEADATDGLCDRFYEAFFDRCPEARPLFGVHAISEREEMLQETLRCLVAFCEGAPWLEGNLRALGASHLEYGVEDGMYAPFVDVYVEEIGAPLTPPLSKDERQALRGGLEAIAAEMQRGARDAPEQKRLAPGEPPR